MEKTKFIVVRVEYLWLCMCVVLKLKKNNYCVYKQRYFIISVFFLSKTMLVCNWERYSSSLKSFIYFLQNERHTHKHTNDETQTETRHTTITNTIWFFLTQTWLLFQVQVKHTFCWNCMANIHTQKPSLRLSHIYKHLYGTHTYTHVHTTCIRLVIHWCLLWFVFNLFLQTHSLVYVYPSVNKV